MTRYSGRTLIEQPSVGSWGQPAAGGIGDVAGYGVATGTPSVSSTFAVSSLNYKRIDFTASSTLVVSVAGLFDVLMASGGGGGGEGTGYGGEGGGGGSSSQLLQQTIFLPAATYTVTVGAAGAQGFGVILAGQSGIYTSGSTNYFLLEPAAGVVGGQSWGGGNKAYNGSGASYRGGYGGNPSVAGTGLGGFAGGASNGVNAAGNGGGGGAGGAGASGARGAGLALSFTGSSVTYCQGGLPASATTGATNTGSGGGGATAANTGSNGGSGFVCVRWRVA